MKPRVLSQLSRRYPVEEVGFEAMLRLVQDCERLQDDDNVNTDKRGSLQMDDGNNKNLSLMTLMSGIVPGDEKLFCCVFTITSASPASCMDSSVM